MARRKASKPEDPAAAHAPATAIDYLNSDNTSPTVAEIYEQFHRNIIVNGGMTKFQADQWFVEIIGAKTLADDIVLNGHKNLGGHDANPSRILGATAAFMHIAGFPKAAALYEQAAKDMQGAERANGIGFASKFTSTTGRNRE